MTDAILAAVLASVPDVVYVVDRERRVLHMNDAASNGYKRVFGIDRRLGERYDEGFPPGAGHDHAVRMGRALDGEEQRFEVKLVEGQYRRIVLTPVRVGGDVVAVVVVSRVIAGP